MVMIMINLHKTYDVDDADGDAYKMNIIKTP